MKILTTDDYCSPFNVPEQADHAVERVHIYELARYWAPALAVAAYAPGKTFDIAHFFNKIPPILRKPWVVTFESSLPRMFPPSDPLRSYLRDRLAERNCLAIIAISNWALHRFRAVNESWPNLPKVLEKTRVLHPCIAVHNPRPKTLQPGETIHLVFVGNNFARKGGVVALRLARKAMAQGLPLHVHLVSSKMIYTGSHTDHPDSRLYDPDLQNLSLPNVTFHGARNNAEVLALMDRCHVTLLATLHDTYGYSVLEGFANGLPAITSAICALPEFVLPYADDASNGFLLNLPKNREGCWRYVEDAATPDYWDKLDDAFERMSDQALAHLTLLAQQPQRLEQLSAGALRRIKESHDVARHAQTLDSIYQQAFAQ
jgi:glycosyltransferase involved in cell wall biosynthesis